MPKRRLSKDEVDEVLRMIRGGASIRRVTKNVRMCRYLVSKIVKDPESYLAMDSREDLRKYGPPRCLGCGGPLPCRECAQAERARRMANGAGVGYDVGDVELRLKPVEQERYERLRDWRMANPEASIEEFYELELVREREEKEDADH